MRSCKPTLLFTHGGHAPSISGRKMALKLAVNISFLFKEKPFLERFSAAASAGEVLIIPYLCLRAVGAMPGFKGVEWGAEVLDQFTKEELVAAKEKAGVEVIGLCTPAGMLE